MSILVHAFLSLRMAPQGLCHRARPESLAAAKLTGVPSLTNYTPVKCNNARGRFVGDPIPWHARKLVLRRTSEHWWEDEEEFDAITEVVVPKRLHLVAPAAAVTGSSGNHTGAAARAAHGDAAAAGWGPLTKSTQAAVLAAAGGKFASGFCSPKLKAEAEACWRALRQDGPPFFKKVRTRAALDVLEDETAGPGALSAAAEELWSELCGQTWRVELDYGLEGAVSEPRDELLLVCSWLAATRMVSHAGLSPHDEGVDEAATRRAGFLVVRVSGYNAAEQGDEGRPRSWRDLQPQLQPIELAATAVATTAAAAAVP